MPREISAELVADTVRELFLEANFFIGRDIEKAVERGAELESGPVAGQVLGQILASYRLAREERLPICQDTGLAVVFAEVGRDVHLTGDLARAVDEGVRRAYRDGYFRASVAADPLFGRLNTGDNTPAVLHTEIVEGDRLTLTAMPKGFGAENCSRVKMFVPANTVEDLKEFLLESVVAAGPNICPPSVIGVGLGSTLEGAALLAKKSLLREIGLNHPDPRYADLERDWLAAVNELGLGPGGLGGAATALAVNINAAPTHIASLPMAVNFCCHASRHARRSI